MLRVVVGFGSMAHAPESLPLSEPAISKTIAEMERSLAVQFLDRSARGVTPSA